MGFGQAVKTGFSKYATFSGRARRSEFWWWMLFQTLVLLPFTIIFTVTYFILIFSLLEAAGPSGEVEFSQGNWVPLAVAGALMLVASLALALPSYAVWARRLHDMGQTGWWLLLNFASLGLVPLIMSFFDSEARANQWGEDPKAGERVMAPAGYAAQGYAAAPPAPPGPPAPPTQ